MIWLSAGSSLKYNQIVYVPLASVNRQQIEEGVARAAKDLARTVVRIRYDFEDDWTGDPSIFFKVVLTNQAAKPPKLYEHTREIREVLEREVRPLEHGLNYYFNFRSVKEQSELQEFSWA